MEINTLLLESPFIKEANCQHEEKRVRIGSGITGLVGLWQVCEFLNQECYLNPKSGIHYHIDLGKDDFTTLEIAMNNYPIYSRVRGYTLKQLDKWGYKGKFNVRRLCLIDYGTSWVELRKDYKTIEYRIGEMSFDYKLLVKRINHCQRITCKIIQMANEL